MERRLIGSRGWWQDWGGRRAEARAGREFSRDEILETHAGCESMQQAWRLGMRCREVLQVVYRRLAEFVDAHKELVAR